MRNLKRRRHRILILISALVLLGMIASSQIISYNIESKANEPTEPAPAETTAPKGDPVQKAEAVEKVREDKSIYADDDDLSVVTMYLTVREGNSADNTDHSWSEINTNSAYYYDELGLPRYNCEALLQIGDENGPLEGEVGYGEVGTNAAVQIRGQTSSKFEQKNYKIRLKPGKGEWRGQRTIALNKHQHNYIRFSNKLAYDVIKKVPQMIGARTQFVHLYVKDETEGGSGVFEDYGLYTQVEQMNKTYLKSHGLDNRGQLYKINAFEWYRYEDAVMLKDDPQYDAVAFEKLLEIKGNDDHSKLISVLDKLNNYAVPIEEIVEQHFDIENLSYWVAFHILIGNVDTAGRNLFIYSPLNSEKFYFISWDSDAAFSRKGHELRNNIEGQSWEQGITQFVGTVLFRRIFAVEEYRQALDMAMNDLRENYLSSAQLDEMAQGYRSVVEQYLFSDPDDLHKNLSDREAYRNLVDAISGEVELNYQYYLQSLEKPWPFFIGIPYAQDGRLHVNWDTSYDIDGERITYTVLLARDYYFNDVIAKKEGVRIPKADFDLPPAGGYYLRVQATNESGYTQDCFDYFVTPNSGKAYGTYAFFIDDQGRVTIPAYE